MADPLPAGVQRLTHGQLKSLVIELLDRSPAGLSLSALVERAAERGYAINPNSASKTLSRLVENNVCRYEPARYVLPPARSCGADRVHDAAAAEATD